MGYLHSLRLVKMTGKESVEMTKKELVEMTGRWLVEIMGMSSDCKIVSI